MQLRKATVFLFHALIVLVPLFFYAKTDELFEFNKIMLTYVFAALIMASWIGRMIVEKRIIFRKTPFDIPLMLFLCSQILSTIFSMHPRTSWFGYYSRFNGGLLSILTYIALFYAFVNTFTKEEVIPFLRTALYGAFLVALYAIPEHFGYSPSCLFITGKFDVACWVQDVKSRVFATFGQPNWLAAYYIFLLPVTAVFFLKSKRAAHAVTYGVLLAAFFSTLLFTSSRSGVLGLAIGVVFAAAQVVVLRMTTKTDVLMGHWKSFFLLIGAFIVLFVMFGSPLTPSLTRLWSTITPTKQTTQTPSSPAAPQTGTQLENGGTESGVIRSIVWKGAVQIWKRYPLFGSGVETFAYSYYRDRPMEHNLVSEWDFLYNKAHNEFLNYLATTGAVGFGAYIIMILSVYLYMERALFRKHESAGNDLFVLAMIAGYTALHISNFFGFSTVVVQILFYLLPAWLFVLFEGESVEEKQHGRLTHTQWLFTLALLLLTGISLNSIIKLWRADIAYAQAKQYAGAQLPAPAVQSIETAITLSPNEALFHDEFSSLATTLAVSAATQKQATLSAQLAKTAIEESNRTLALNNVHLNFYRSRARVFITLSQIDTTALDEAKRALQKAHELAPTDAKLVFNLGVIAESQKNLDEAKRMYEMAIQMKPNYDAAKERLGKLGK